MSSAMYAALLAGAFAILFGLAEILHRYMLVPAETTRKLVHIGTGLLTLLFPLLLDSIVAVGLLCGLFLIILLLSMHFRLLPSIHAIRRKSSGSLLYPVIVFGAYLFYERFDGAGASVFHPLYYFYTPVLIMAICDPLAAGAGQAWRRSHPETLPGKTLAGSFAFLCCAVLLSACLAALFNQRAIPFSGLVLNGILIAFVTTLAERFSGYGTDNFTIPAGAMLVIQLLENALKTFPAP